MIGHSKEEMSNLIAYNNHSYVDHSEELSALNVNNQDDYAQLINETINSPSTLTNINTEGRTQFYNEDNNLFVSFRPTTQEHGTAFCPKKGVEYYKDQVVKSQMHQYVMGNKEIATVESIDDIQNIHNEKAFQDAITSGHTTVKSNPEAVLSEPDEIAAVDDLDLSSTTEENSELDTPDDIEVPDLDDTNDLSSEDTSLDDAISDFEMNDSPDVSDSSESSDVSDSFDDSYIGDDGGDMDAGDDADGPDVGDD